MSLCPANRHLLGLLDSPSKVTSSSYDGALVLKPLVPIWRLVEGTQALNPVEFGCGLLRFYVDELSF